MISLRREFGEGFKDSVVWYADCKVSLGASERITVEEVDDYMISLLKPSKIHCFPHPL